MLMGAKKAVVVSRLTAFLRMRSGEKEKPQARRFVSPTAACRSDVLLCYFLLRVKAEKGHNTTLGDMCRLDVCVTRAKVPPCGEFRCRVGHMYPFLFLE
jgi:hypothetical protein